MQLYTTLKTKLGRKVGFVGKEGNGMHGSFLVAEL